MQTESKHRVPQQWDEAKKALLITKRTIEELFEHPLCIHKAEYFMVMMITKC